MHSAPDKTRHVVDFLFVIALFLMFALSSLMLIALGAGIYRKNTDSMTQNYTVRSSHAYLSEKVRAADTAGAVSTGELDGLHALVLRQQIEGVSYTTYLYLYEGFLTELFSREDVTLPASAGMKLFPLTDLRFRETDFHTLCADITETDGRTHTVVLSLRADAGSDDNEGD